MTTPESLGVLELDGRQGSLRRLLGKVQGFGGVLGHVLLLGMAA